MGIGVGLVLYWQYGVNRWVALGGTTLLTLLIALWLVWADYRREAEELKARSTPGAQATDSYAG
jgi:type VI protein secretion system component VasK